MDESRGLSAAVTYSAMALIEIEGVAVVREKE